MAGHEPQETVHNIDVSFRKVRSPNQSALLRGTQHGMHGAKYRFLVMKVPHEFGQMCARSAPVLKVFVHGLEAGQSLQKVVGDSFHYSINFFEYPYKYPWFLYS